jgi:hypothetical protein
MISVAGKYRTWCRRLLPHPERDREALAGLRGNARDPGKMNFLKLQPSGICDLEAPSSKWLVFINQ